MALLHFRLNIRREVNCGIRFELSSVGVKTFAGPWRLLLLTESFLPLLCHLFTQYPPPLVPPRGEVNAADAFDIGSFDEDDVKGIKVIFLAYNHVTTRPWLIDNLVPRVLWKKRTMGTRLVGWQNNTFFGIICMKNSLLLSGREHFWSFQPTFSCQPAKVIQKNG